MADRSAQPLSYAEAASPLTPRKRKTSHTPTPAPDLTNSHVNGNDVSQFEQKAIVTSIPEQPQTEKRQPYVHCDEEPLANPGTARAIEAASREKPNGTSGQWAAEHQRQVVVQQHVDYFDIDGDGIIWPSDTYYGCRKFGWGVPLSLYATFIINVNLSYPTVPGWLPDPFFRIYMERLYRSKHGSDSMSYDSEGRFRSQNFEDIFAKYDRGNKGGLTIWDVLQLWNGQKMVLDFFGWGATAHEWIATYLLIWPEDGIMRKEEIRRVFDGSMYQIRANEHQDKMARRRARRRQQGWAWPLTYGLETASSAVSLVLDEGKKLSGMLVKELHR